MHMAVALLKFLHLLDEVTVETIEGGGIVCLLVRMMNSLKQLILWFIRINLGAKTTVNIYLGPLSKLNTKVLVAH